MQPKYDTNSKEVISFRKKVNASEIGVIEERIKAPATIEGIRVRFYQGQQLALQVRPVVEHKGHKVEELITYPQGTSRYISGENDYFVYDIVVSADNDDYIKIYYTNTDAVNAYTLSVDVVVDYFGGMNRVV